jgi:hypothetical protein
MPHYNFGLYRYKQLEDNHGTDADNEKAQQSEKKAQARLQGSYENKGRTSRYQQKTR